MATLVASAASLALTSTASAHHIAAAPHLTMPIEELVPLPDEPDLFPILPTESVSYNGTVPAIFVDTDEIPGKLLLRFDTVIANQGGTADVICTACNTAGAAVSQAIWDGGRPPASDEPSAITGPTSGPSVVTINPITAASGGPGAGGWMFYYPNPGHVHWHYDRAAKYELIVQNGLAGPGGTTTRVASKTDIGFCLFDTYDQRGAVEAYFISTGAANPNVDIDGTIPDDEDWCRPGNPGLAANADGLGEGFVRMGISPGVGDYYAAQLTDQWVDITGLAPGPVTIRATVNPDGAIEETDTSNNTLEVTRTIPGTLATPSSGTVPADIGGPVAISGTIIGAGIPIYLPNAQHIDPVSGPQSCALRFGDCYAGADPNTLSFQIVTPPSSGTATVAAANGLTGTVQYTPNAGFVGTDTFTFIAIDTRGFQSAPATATITVSDDLVNVEPPTIAGTLAVGQKLRASKGAWSPEPTGHSYQWQRCNAAGSSCANIGGATQASHTLSQLDGASTLRVTVTATRNGKSASATSAVTGVIATVSKLPNRLVRKLFKGTSKADKINGTRKHDLIKSGAGGDTIKAKAGSDIIKSGKGHDLIYAGKGKDTVVAGKGKDDVRALDKMRDVINCGPGFDKVLADLIDKIHKSCEDVTQR